MPDIWSIGHSTLDIDTFLSRLKLIGITAVADVRTSPYSRNVPHFNKDQLKRSLIEAGVAYVYLGTELGGRPSSPLDYTDGVADYEKMATSAQFEAGLQRLEKGATQFRIAMMCSEGAALDCHRCLLVSRALARRGWTICHVTADGGLIDHADIETQLLVLAGKQSDDMFSSAEDRLDDAYRMRARKVAFTKPTDTGQTSGERLGVYVSEPTL